MVYNLRSVNSWSFEGWYNHYLLCSLSSIKKRFNFLKRVVSKRKTHKRSESTSFKVGQIRNLRWTLRNLKDEYKVNPTTKRELLRETASLMCRLCSPARTPLSLGIILHTLGMGSLHRRIHLWRSSSASAGIDIVSKCNILWYFRDLSLFSTENTPYWINKSFHDLIWIYDCWKRT